MQARPRVLPFGGNEMDYDDVEQRSGLIADDPHCDDERPLVLLRALVHFPSNRFFRDAGLKFP
jgi:hypothetical protein